MRTRVPVVLVVALVALAALLLVRSCGDGEAGSGRVDDVLTRFPDPTPGGDPGTIPVDAATPLAQFVQFVFDDTQQFWAQQFQEAGLEFPPARLALHGGRTRSACGVADQSVGPFYCPADRAIYVDVPFLEALDDLGAPGDMAQAYVVAHEMAHHVQAQLGITDRVAEQQQRDPASANDLSVRLELQADCFAGVWANSTRQRGLLEPGDIEEGLAAAAAVGDDRIQAGTTGTVDPDLFTHGTSADRQEWFLRGFETGDPNACDTFA